MSANCPENINLFCYVCGKRAFSTNTALLTEQVERAFKLYFDSEIIRGVSWAPDKICKTCYNALNMWIQGKRSSLSFGVPMILTDPGEHNSDNCYACANKICGVNRKGLKRRVYISVRSAQIPLPHSDEIPIPSLPSPDRETSFSIETMDQSDFTYKPTPEAGPSNKIIPISQVRMDKIVAELNLSQREAEKLAQLLKEGNNLEPNVKVTGYRRRQLLFQRYYTLNEGNTFVYCHDIKGLMEAMAINYVAADFRMFIDSSKSSLKVVLLHKYNKKPSIPIGYSTDMSETYDSMKIILDKVCYTDHMWRISCDLKVVAMLRGLQGGYTKNMCFLCLWDTRFKGNQYETHDWLPRDPTEKGHNCVNDPLVPMENVLMPPLHIKLGIVKNFIKAIVKQPKILDCLKNIFPRISEAKLKEGVLNGPDIRKLMKSKEFKGALDGNDYFAWRAVKKVIRYFLGSTRAHNYPALVTKMLHYFQKIGVNMSLKIHFLHHHLEYFSKQLASESDEHGERFHQVAMPMETRYKGKRLDSLLAEICWWSQKTYDPDNEDEEEEYTMGVSSEGKSQK